MTTTNFSVFCAYGPWLLCPSCISFPTTILKYLIPYNSDILAPTNKYTINININLYNKDFPDLFQTDPLTPYWAVYHF